MAVHFPFLTSLEQDRPLQLDPFVTELLQRLEEVFLVDTVEALVQGSGSLPAVGSMLEGVDRFFRREGLELLTDFGEADAYVGAMKGASPSRIVVRINR